jgi:hypothetical protein
MADCTMFKDPVTTICAMVGAGLGVFNFVQSNRRGALHMTRPVLLGFLYEHEQPKVFSGRCSTQAASGAASSKPFT